MLKMLRVALQSGVTHCFLTVPLSLNLPVGPVLVTGERGQHYLSYAGAKGEEGILSIAGEFARALKLQEGDWVTVAPVSLPLIPTLEVDPVDFESWETIQSHAEYFESAILRQISVVEKDQIIPLWLNSAHSIQLKVCDFGQIAGMLTTNSEIHVNAKARERPVSRKKTLRNIVTKIPGFAAKNAEIGQVFIGKMKKEIGLGVVISTECAENHIKSPFFTDFFPVEIEEMKLPAFNIPFSVHKTTSISTLLPTLPIKITLFHPHDSQSFFNYFSEISTTAVILVDKLQVEIQGIEFKVEIKTEIETLGCVYVDAKLPGFDALKSLFQFEYSEKEPEKLFLTSQKRGILEKVTEELVRYFTQKTPSGSMLLHGVSGVGKTSFLTLLQTSLKPHLIGLIPINCSELTLTEDRYFEEIKEFVAAAEIIQPAVLVFDGIDGIAKKVDVDSAEGSAIDAGKMEKNVNWVIELMERMKRMGKVKVIFTVRDIGGVPDRMLETGVCDTRICLQPPDLPERTEIWKSLLPDIANPEELAHSTQSFLPIDILNLIRNARLQSNLHPSNSLSEHIQSLLPVFVPQALQALPIVRLTTLWEDIGGLEEAKDVLLETLELPMKYSGLFKSYPMKLRSGVLLYGPPGCGKTMLGMTIAARCHLNFLSIKGPELLNKYIGASEAGVRDLFIKAKSARPAVIFLDEFEAIAPKRGSSHNTGVTDRVVNQFLCELDGVESRTDVFVIAASSRPDLIDAALLRPGRLDKLIYCGWPGNTQRKDIIEKLLRKAGIEGVDLEHIAEQTEGFSGADLQGLVNNLVIRRAHGETMSSEMTLQELHIIRPALNKKQAEEYNQRYERFRSRKTEATGTRVALV